MSTSLETPKTGFLTTRLICFSAQEMLFIPGMTLEKLTEIFPGRFDHLVANKMLATRLFIEGWCFLSLQEEQKNCDHNSYVNVKSLTF